MCGGCIFDTMAESLDISGGAAAAILVVSLLVGLVLMFLLCRYGVKRLGAEAQGGTAARRVYTQMLEPSGAGDYRPPDAALAAERNGVAGGAKTVADHRADVVQFYTEHNPEKLAHIDQVMGQFRGREDQIVPILKHKYGVAP